MKFVLLNPFSASLFNLLWRFAKSLSNFLKAMLNTTSKFTYGLVGARQEWCHKCLFTFHDLLSLLVSVLLIFLPIFLASTTENTSSPRFLNAWPCSKPRFIRRGERRRLGERGDTDIYTVLSITHSELPKVPFAPVRSLSSYCNNMPFTERLLFVQMFVIFFG